jgi:hypothetical protein
MKERRVGAVRMDDYSTFLVNRALSGQLGFRIFSVQFSGAEPLDKKE